MKPIKAIPPTENAKHVAADELTDSEIEAGLLDGSLRPWRTDVNGVDWYERVEGELPRVIHGVPSDD